MILYIYTFLNINKNIIFLSNNNNNKLTNKQTKQTKQTK